MNFPVLELRDEEGNAKQFRACLHGRGGPQIGEVTCDVSTHLSCKRDQIKMRDYMDRRVTLSPRVTSPTRGPHFHVSRPLMTSSQLAACSSIGYECCTGIADGRVQILASLNFSGFLFATP